MTERRDYSIEDLKRAAAARALRAERAKEAAFEVRSDLLRAMERNEPPELDASTVRKSRKAEPFGAFPSHRTLLLAYGDILGQ